MLACPGLIARIQFIGHKWNGNAHRDIVDAMACPVFWKFLDKQEKPKLRKINYNRQHNVGLILFD